MYIFHVERIYRTKHTKPRTKVRSNITIASLNGLHSIILHNAHDLSEQVQQRQADNLVALALRQGAVVLRRTNIRRSLVPSPSSQPSHAPTRTQSIARTSVARSPPSEPSPARPPARAFKPSHDPRQQRVSHGDDDDDDDDAVPTGLTRNEPIVSAHRSIVHRPSRRPLEGTVQSRRKEVLRTIGIALLCTCGIAALDRRRPS